MRTQNKEGTVPSNDDKHYLIIMDFYLVSNFDL